MVTKNYVCRRSRQCVMVAGWRAALVAQRARSIPHPPPAGLPPAASSQDTSRPRRRRPSPTTTSFYTLTKIQNHKHFGVVPYNKLQGSFRKLTSIFNECLKSKACYEVVCVRFAQHSVSNIVELIGFS